MPTIIVEIDGTNRGRNVTFLVETTYEVIDEEVEIRYTNCISSGNVFTYSPEQLDQLMAACVADNEG